MAEVVGEGHPHLEGRAQVGVDQGVGRVGLVGDVRRVRGAVRIHPDPLVAVADTGQPVRIHDAGGDRRQRLAHLRRARDGRRARRGGVRRARDRLRRRAGALLVAAEVVGETHLDLDLLAQVVVSQGVGGGGRVGDVLLVRRAVGVHPHPLVGVFDVVQPVLVLDAGDVDGELLPDRGRAGNHRRPGRRAVQRQAHVHRAGGHAGPVEIRGPEMVAKDHDAVLVRRTRSGNR